jgi:hypothetical protein
MPGAVVDAPALVAKKAKVSKESALAMLDKFGVRWIRGANDGPRPPPPSVREMKNNNQLAIGACDKKSKGWKVIATVIRVANDKEGNGN